MQCARSHTVSSILSIFCQYYIVPIFCQYCIPACDKHNENVLLVAFASQSSNHANAPHCCLKFIFTSLRHCSLNIPLIYLSPDLFFLPLPFLLISILPHSHTIVRCLEIPISKHHFPYSQSTRCLKQIHVCTPDTHTLCTYR